MPWRGSFFFAVMDSIGQRFCPQTKRNNKSRNTSTRTMFSTGQKVMNGSASHKMPPDLKHWNLSMGPKVDSSMVEFLARSRISGVPFVVSNDSRLWRGFRS